MQYNFLVCCLAVAVTCGLAIDAAAQEHPIVGQELYHDTSAPVHVYASLPGMPPASLFQPG